MQEYSRSGAGTRFDCQAPKDISGSIEQSPDRGAGDPLLTPGRDHFYTRGGTVKKVSFNSNDDDIPFKSEVYYSNVDEGLFDEGNM